MYSHKLGFTYYDEYDGDVQESKFKIAKSHWL